MTIKLFVLALAPLILISCQSLHSNDPDSLTFNIPKGSTLSLNKKIMLAHDNTHAVIQYGKETTGKDRQFYDVNCRLNFKKFGPRTIEPETFKITHTVDGTNWIAVGFILRFYTEIYLTSNKNTDVIKMVCQEYGDQADNHFTVKDIETTLGNYFSFNFASINQES